MTGDATTDAPGSTDPAWTLDVGLVDRLDDDTVVEFRDGTPGFVDGEGRFVPLVGRYRRGTHLADDPIAVDDGWRDAETTSDPLAEALQRVEGVVSAVAIGDGSYAVAVETPDVLLGLGLDVAVDAPLALAEDPYVPYQWTLDNTGDNLATLANPPPQTPDADIDGREAAAGSLGEGVVVAVIDTGVDFSHPDLAGQSWANDDEICGNGSDDDGNGYVDDCQGWDFGNDDPDSWSPGQNEHGTHVAGIIGAVAGNGRGIAGLAPEVRIMGLNVEGPGGMSTSSVARAVRYAVDNGADVINMSLGTQPGTPASHVQPLIDAVAHADQHGVLVVVAAGNSSVDIGTSAVYPASIDGPNMIVAGASAPDETRASFSNYGQPVDLFAPGVLILSTTPGGQYKFMSGTSQASPTIAAIAADVLAADPDLDPVAVRQQLVGTGDEFDAYANLASNPVRLNAARALGLGGDGTGVEVTIGALADADTDGVVANITMRAPEELFDGPFHWEASLVAIDGSGQVYGIVEHPVRVDWQPDVTDGRGAVVLGESGVDEARIETSLPPGTYGLVVEAVSEQDASRRLGDAFVSTFVVADHTPPTPGGEGGTTTTSAPGGPTPTTVPAGGGVPSPSTTQTTGAPGPTTSTSTTTATTAPPSPSTSTIGSRPSTPSTTATTRPTTTTVAWWLTTTTNGGGSTTSTMPWWSTTTRTPTTTRSTTTTRTPTTGAPAPTTVPTSTTPAPGPSPSAAPTTGASVPGVTTTSAAPSPPTTTAVGGFAVTLVTPDRGPADDWTMVSIYGMFPSQVFVWFGGQPGDLMYQSSSWILVAAPPGAETGPVDIGLRSPSAGTVLIVDDGFTYTGADGDQAPTTTTTTATSGTPPGSTSTPSPGPSPTTSSTSTPVGPTSTTSSGGSAPTTTGPGESTTTRAPTSSSPGQSTTTIGGGSGGTTGPTVSRAVAAGPPVDLGGGLRGVALQGLGGLGDVPHCTSDPCRTRTI